MGDQPDNIGPVYLRRMDAKLDRVVEDVTDIKRRLTALEVAVGNMAATEMNHYANTAMRADRHEERLDRIERRLAITDG